MADETAKEPILTESEAPQEPISTPEQPIETTSPELTAQIPVNEPLGSEAEPLAPEPEIKLEQAEIPEVKTEEVSPVNEPVIKSEPETVSSPQIQSESISQHEKIPEIVNEPKQEIKSETKPDPKPEPEQPKIIPIIISTKNKARELLIKARSAIQFRKKKKLNKVMTLFLKQSKITNDEVEKFMHVSDATATRYLSQLEKEGKIKQNGKTGKSVFYSKI